VIRALHPSEAPLVSAFYRAAPDYWLLAEGTCDPDRQAAEFFTDAPPGCDPGQSHHLGLFLPASDLATPSRGEEGGVEGTPGQKLSAVAELSFGFPSAVDAYLGLMLLGPWAQGAGHGRTLLAEVERLARIRGAPQLYLTVLDANPRGRAFWEREGFCDTGLSRHDSATGHRISRLVKPL
jgi:GNAT superfamily N-acetyltransferase